MSLASYTIARLHEMKEAHERWVDESLATEQDKRELAAELTYAALVDSAAENLWLESWLAWTNKALQSTPIWHEELPDAIGRFGSDVFLANFPVAAGFRKRTLGQFGRRFGVIPAKVGQVQKHSCTLRAGRDLGRQRLE
jgi:hypothetical protein